MNSNTTLVKVKYYKCVFKYHFQAIQIQHLLKLNDEPTEKKVVEVVIQIQHLLKLNKDKRTVFCCVQQFKYNTC